MNTLLNGVSSCPPAVHSLRCHSISFLKFRIHLMLPIKWWREDSSAWQMVLTSRHLGLPLSASFSITFLLDPSPIHSVVFPLYAISLHLPPAFIQNDLTSSLLIILVFSSCSNSKYLRSQMSSNLRKKFFLPGLSYGPEKIILVSSCSSHYMVITIFKIYYIVSHLFNC